MRITDIMILYHLHKHLRPIFFSDKKCPNQIKWVLNLRAESCTLH